MNNSSQSAPPKIDVGKFPPIAIRENLGGAALSVDGDVAMLRYMPGEHLLNPVGIVFGGHIAGMIDDAAALITWFAGGKRPFATAQLSVNFLRAVKPGEALIAAAQLVGAGNRQAFVEVKLTREADGKPVATGSLVQTFTGDIRGDRTGEA